MVKPDLKIVVSNPPAPASRPQLPPEQVEMPFARGQRRADHAAAARSVHPAAGAGGVSRGLRRPARSAAVPDPPAEPRHSGYSDRRDHAPVHAVHRADAGPAARARRRIPGDGRDAGRDQIAHAAAAAAGSTTSGEEDPRAELVRRLQEYERFKRAAEDIDALPRLERDVWQAERRAAEQRQSCARCRRSRCRRCWSPSRTSSCARADVRAPSRAARAAVGAASA